MNGLQLLQADGVLWPNLTAVFGLLFTPLPSRFAGVIDNHGSCLDWVFWLFLELQCFRGYFTKYYSVENPKQPKCPAQEKLVHSFTNFYIALGIFTLW